MSTQSYDALKELLRKTEGVVVAFSGGVDSSLLLAAATDALDSAVLAVTGISPTFPQHDLTMAKTVAEQLGARWMTLKTNELNSQPAVFPGSRPSVFRTASFTDTAYPRQFPRRNE